MSFGQNLQLLRRMRRGMTQEELADRMGVSRQTVSKWETDLALPEMDKVMALCDLFSCSMDQLVREDMTAFGEAYFDVRMEWVEPIRCLRYAVVSAEPEDDAIHHVKTWAERLGIKNPRIIGWDFPVVSQEQINVYNMHGYAAALLLDEGVEVPGAEPLCQPRQRYLAITIREPFTAPFRLIPNAYRIIDTYMRANGLKHAEKIAIPCFERTYDDGARMDVYIAIE